MAARKKAKPKKIAKRAAMPAPDREFKLLQTEVAELVRAATARDLQRIGAVAEKNDAAMELAMTLAFLVKAVQDKAQDSVKAQPVAEDSFSAIKRMANVIGHEVRNPLAVISNSTYFIKTKLSAGPPLDEKVAKHLGFIESEIKKANGIIDDILAFTRPPQVNRSKTDLHAFVQSLLEQYPAKEGIVFEKNLSAGLSALIDPDQLAQAVRKLLDNAVEAMPSGGKIVVTATSTKEGRPTVMVTDVGSGIAPDVVGRVFEPFFTTKPRGVGLGLAVAESIVKAHEGELFVESWLGKGSTFVILLP